MTDKELERMSKLWADGYLLKQISSEMGYTKLYVSQVISKHRDIFPYRQCRMTDDQRRQYVNKVIEKKTTARQAARDAGVHVNTIHRWVRWYKDGRL